MSLLHGIDANAMKSNMKVHKGESERQHRRQIKIYQINKYRHQIKIYQINIYRRQVKIYQIDKY